MSKYLVIILIFRLKFSLITFGYERNDFDGILTHDWHVEWGFLLKFGLFWTLFWIILKKIIIFIFKDENTKN